MSREVISSGSSIGAEIRGVDASQPLDQVAIDHVYSALLEHCVVYLRDQTLTQRQLVDFTNNFGVAVEHVREQPPREVDEVFIISNVKENGQEIGALGSSEVTFHSDLSYMPKPGTLSMLYAIEIPSSGGATTWCDCRAAYDALSEQKKSELDGLHAVHRHYVESQNPPGIVVDHPVVVTHPETGRQSLYVGPHLTKHLVDTDPGVSDCLLGELYEHQENPSFHYTHDWQVHDLVIWDNRPTMHRREPFPADQRRLMWRTQIFNDVAPLA